MTADSNPPAGHAIREQRLDETETGDAKLLSVIEMRRPPGLPPDASAVGFVVMRARAVEGGH